jgi:hydrogenase-4 membrane subunit HyfE
MAARISLLPIFLLFVSVNALTIAFRERLEARDFDADLIIWSNLILCALTLFSHYLLYKGMRARTTAGFLKAVYGSFLFKLLLVGGLVAVYVFTHRETANKASLITSMVLYLVYTAVEVRSLLMLSRPQKNA